MNSAIRNYALLFFGSILFHLAGTWNLPLIDRDEPRFAEASREMLERGDYVVPYFNNQFRLDKPPLTYWAQIASYKIFGENDFAARFPSAVATALTAIAIFAWGSRIGGTKTAWWAAIIFTFSLQTFVHAKAAVADMWLVLFMTLAHWAGYELIGFCNRPTAASGLTVHRPRQWWWVFYVSLAFAFLAKGPIGWLPLATVGATKLFLRNRQLARQFKFARGIFLTLAIVALWGIPALVRTHGQFFIVGIGRHVVGRSFASMEGHGANSFGIYLLLLPFYFVTIFIGFFPWSIKLPWLTKNLWRRRDEIDNYLIAGVAIIFIIFTLVETKLPHYTLPAFPLLALLLARYWSRQDRSAARELDGFKPSSVCTVEVEPIGGSSRSFFKVITIATISLYLAIALIVPPLIVGLFPAKALFQQSRIYLQPDMQFASVDFEEPSLVWYFRSRVHSFLTTMNKRRAAEFMERLGPRFVVLPTPMAETLFAERPESWKMFSTRGFNIAKGKRVDLTLVLKPE